MTYETAADTPEHLEEIAERVNELLINELGYDHSECEIVASDVAVLVSADEEGRAEPTRVPAPDSDE